MLLLAMLAVLVGKLTAQQICAEASFTDGSGWQQVERSGRVAVQTAESGCLVRLLALAVGGGGDGAAIPANGGGSGMVEWQEVRQQWTGAHLSQLLLDPAGFAAVLEIEVGKDGNFGGAGERSAVSLAGGELLLEAGGGSGGGDDDTKGGDGYRSGFTMSLKILMIVPQRRRGWEHGSVPRGARWHRGRGWGAVAFQQQRLARLQQY